MVYPINTTAPLPPAADDHASLTADVFHGRPLRNLTYEHVNFKFWP